MTTQEAVAFLKGSDEQAYVVSSNREAVITNRPLRGGKHKFSGWRLNIYDKKSYHYSLIFQQGIPYTLIASEWESVEPERVAVDETTEVLLISEINEPVSV